MTKEQFAKGKEILDKIDIAERRKQDIEKLMDRMNQITGKYEKTVNIQLGEQYMYTPVAEVRLEHFGEFLANQIHLTELEIKSLMEEFASI